MTDTQGLASYRWQPENQSDQKPRGIYLLHGLGEHAGRYEAVAQWLTQQGWTVAAHDHHGHGKSAGKRGRFELGQHPGDEPRYVADARAQFESFAQEMASLPILLAHSMGGLIAADLVITRKMPVAGLILSSPAMRPLLSRFQKWQVNAMYALAPDLVIKSKLSGNRVSHDPAMAKAYDEDDLAHGAISARLVRWMIDTGDQAVANAAALDVDLLLMVAGADSIVDAQFTRHMMDQLPAEQTQAHWYDDYFHEIFNEEPTRRDRVLADVAAWLAARTNA